VNAEEAHGRKSLHVYHRTAMARGFTFLLCVFFAIPLYARLGETVPQLIKRYGKSYTAEYEEGGKRYKFRSANLSVDSFVINGVSVGETYYSDHPLTSTGEPPREIVQAILGANAPKARWHESYTQWGDSGLESADQRFLAVLMYLGPLPENATWVVVVARAENLQQSIPVTPSSSQSPAPTAKPTPPVMSESQQITPSAAPSPISSPAPEWIPSTKLCSSNGNYCITIAETNPSNKTANPRIHSNYLDQENRTLTVSMNGKTVAQYPTYGYLLGAFWSPDNKYVAANNRRANAGDYLWVISLSDGAALKMPDDLATELGKKNLGHIGADDPWGKTVQFVRSRYTECAHNRLEHQFLFAQGWKNTSELLVEEELQFSKEPPQKPTITAPGSGKGIVATLGFYGPGAPGIWITINKACRVSGNKISLKEQAIEKHERSSAFVDCAWTYGSYWTQNPAEDSFNSGQAKQAKGDLDGAIADYSHAIEISPKVVAGYFHRGNAKVAKGDFDGAIADYDSVVELDPKNVYAYNNRGLTKQAKGDSDGAIADYNRALELDPKNTYAYNNRGLVKDDKRDYDGAIADCTRAIELDPKDAKSYRNRGFAKQGKSDVDGAIADYTRAIELDPKYATAYIDRGLAKSLLRDWEGALADYRGFCELSVSGQDYPRLFIWLIRSRLGEKDAVNKELSDYLGKRPSAASGDWVSKVAGHLLGNIAEADLFAAAASPDAKTDSGQRCEAWFYAGMKKLFDGDKKTAANYFQKCLATDQKDFNEFQLAQSELKALGK
jgi:lipoprotein NlpI